MQKLFKLSEIMIPSFAAMNVVDMADGKYLVNGAEKRSKFLSALLVHHYPATKNIDSLRVKVIEVSKEVAKQFAKEVDLSTFSFDVTFHNCVGLKCYDYRSKFESIGEGRPIIPIVRGTTPAFVVFTYNGIPLVSLNLYHRNFPLWAERIGLRATMNQRTENPSTHFVYREKAEGLGLLWFNKQALNLYNLVSNV